MNHPIMFLDRVNKIKLVPAFLFFRFKNSYERKIIFSLKWLLDLSRCWPLALLSAPRPPALGPHVLQIFIAFLQNSSRLPDVFSYCLSEYRGFKIRSMPIVLICLVNFSDSCCYALADNTFIFITKIT